MSPEVRAGWEDEEINLRDYWQPVKKHGWMILGLFLVSVSAAGFLSYFVMTKIYESKASILAPKESAGAGGGLATLLATSGSGGGAGQLLGGLLSTGGTNRDAFLAILKSRTMAQDLVDRFKLNEYYEAKYNEEAIKRLRGVTEILISKEGVISVAVEDKDPKLAADIANAYIANLDRLMAKLGTTDASRQRVFVADRLEKTEKTLRQAEESLRHFQEKNKAIVIQEQAKGAIEEAAKLKGQIVAAETQLEFMRSFATESNPQVIAQKRQIEELKRQLGQMQYGRGIELPPENAQSGKPRTEFHVSFARVPELGMELLRLTREVKIQEAVFTLLTQQFEQAKIGEAKDTPVVQVLDRAVPAEQKSKPITRLYMAVAGLLSLLVGVLLALLWEHVGRARTRKAVPAA